jgi:glycosyltransferase involved in cell wall biosynthesis
MHLVLLTSVASTIDRFFPRWIEFWQQNGVTVTTVSAGTSGASDNHHTIEALTQSPNRRTLSAHGQLSVTLRQLEPDIILTNTAHASALARVRPRGKIIYFCHGLHWSDHQTRLQDKLFKWVERRLLSRTVGVICMNLDDEKFFRTHYRGPIMRLPYGIGLDIRLWTPRPPHPPSSPRELVQVGSLSPRKRPIDSLYVLRHLLDRGLDVRLTYVGAGSLEKELRDRAKGLGGHITFAGHTDPTPYLARSDALLHPASWEGLSRVLLEAAAMRVPAVGYATKGVRDLQSVLCVPRVGDTLGMARATESVLNESYQPTYPSLHELSDARAFASVHDFIVNISASESSRSHEHG